MPPRSPRLPGAGDVVAGKYRLERLLKQGGMGAVWVATHLGLDERVALKFMDPRRVSSPDARMRFTLEAKAAAQIRSANIVQILDHGVDNHVPYIAMELLSGEDLGGRLRRAGKLSMSEASTLLEEIAHALDRAHAAGIVHRDLKPENIFLSKDGDHEVPKILDFGIALEIQPDASDDSAATQDGVLLGTPYFMSPEQVRGRTNIDHRSDLWSLGVILFRAITGIRPFGRGAAADVIVQICSDPIPRASVVAPDLPEEVDRFFEKALAREPAKRFASAKEMAAAFAEIAKIAEAAERTQVDGIAPHASRPAPARASRRGPPPLPGSSPPPVAFERAGSRGGEGAFGALDRAGSRGAEGAFGALDRASSRGAEGAERAFGAGGTESAGSADESSRPKRSSGVLRKAAPSGPGVSPESAADRSQPSATMRAPGVELPGAESAPATLPPSAEVAEAITAEVHADSKVEAALARMDAAAAATRSEERARAAQADVATPKVTERHAPPAERAERTERVERAGEGRARTWVVVAALAVAAAALVFGFREQIFAPPPAKDPNGATIVLTAGTVVLVGPGGRIPVEVPGQVAAAETAAASPTATATAEAASAAATTSAAATGATTTSAAASAGAATGTASPPSSAGGAEAAGATASTAGAAAITGAAAGTAASTGTGAATAKGGTGAPAPRPTTVETKPIETKPAETTKTPPAPAPTKKKDEPDLGY